MAPVNFKTDNRISSEQRALLREFCSSLGNELIDLATTLGVKVFAEELWPYESGYLEYAPSKGSTSGYRIVVNSTHPPERQRFTVAHELGHFLLHRNDSDFNFRAETAHRSDDYFEYIEPHKPAQEIEANYFAATILMPENLFVPSYNRLSGNINQLSRLFFVSRSAVHNRCKELCLTVGF